jgi:hypothetical protein
MPVRKRLLLVLLDGEKHGYVCQQCGTSCASKLEPVPAARLVNHGSASCRARLPGLRRLTVSDTRTPDTDSSGARIREPLEADGHRARRTRSS